MNKISLKQRLRYAFDNTMSKGTPAIIAWLGIISLAIILLAAAAFTIFGLGQGDGEPMSFIEAAWVSLMRTLDAGTMGGDEGWGFRLIAFGVTLGGVFVISILIGALSSGIEAKLEELRKGHSMVCEKDHTLILGWSSKVATLISELVIANANRHHPRIVVLANRDKVEMEEEIKSLIPKTGRTQIICRSGDSDSMQDLALVRPYDARSIIILSPEDESDNDADGQTLKSILALTNSPHRTAKHLHIIAEIREPANIEVARIVGKDEVELILTDDLVSRIMVQTCRQSGLSVVYQELLDFDGAEIYFQAEPGLVGKTFAEALLAYEDSSLMGLQFKNGTVKINPPHDTIILEGDKIIAISEDDDTLVLRDTAKPAIQTTAICQKPKENAKAERTLLLGWNRRAAIILSELNNYVQAGSRVVIVTPSDSIKAELSMLQSKLDRITLEHHDHDPTNRLVLNQINPASFDHILVLASSDEIAHKHADSRVLITLLHLRNMQEIHGIDLNIVTEMMDTRNRELAEITKADDFIVSDKLISLLMSQVSENKALMQVFEDLFAAEGSEIYLKPVSNYITPGVALSYATLLESAHRQGEIALGWRVMSQAYNAHKAYGVRINPAKSEMITLTSKDFLIVIAED